MANGEVVHVGTIALSRKLAQDLGLKKSKGAYDYRFGTKIILSGSNGYDGVYIFKDLMPPKWNSIDNGYRVDIHFPTNKQCYIFGKKKYCKLSVKERDG